MNNYAVINQQNEIVNAILWDGVSPYDPGEGLTLIEAGDLTIYIGGTYDASSPWKFIPPNPGGEAVYNPETNAWDLPAPPDAALGSDVVVNPSALPA